MRNILELAGCLIVITGVALVVAGGSGLGEKYPTLTGYGIAAVPVGLLIFSLGRMIPRRARVVRYERYRPQGRSAD